MESNSQLQTLIDNTYAQLIAIQGLKMSVLSTITTMLSGGTPDVSSLSSSGVAGGESWTLVTLQQKLNDLTKQEEVLTKVYQDQILIYCKLFSFDLTQQASVKTSPWGITI